jgi:hypothetical protein
MKTIGLLPMVLSRDEAAAMWKSLSLTVLCGTITGTMLTLLIIPTAYYLMDKPKEGFKGFIKNMRFLFEYMGFIKKGRLKLKGAVLKSPLPSGIEQPRGSQPPRIPKMKI